MSTRPKKSEVYAFLQKKWSSVDDPREIVRDLKRFQAPFMDLVAGGNLSGHSKPIAEIFHRFYRMTVPTSILPFLMQLSVEVKRGIVSEQSAAEILSVCESFLVRRALCGIEPTGLHAVFKRLWKDLNGEFTGAKVKSVIRSHRTVSWPTDADVKRNIVERPMYGASIVNYFISEYNAALGGDNPQATPWIEHVLPQKPEDVWWDTIAPDAHERLVDTLANLLPLSEKMNKQIGNAAYEKKRLKFQEDSMFKTARDFANKFERWTAVEIEERAIILADWTVERWAH